MNNADNGARFLVEELHDPSAAVLYRAWYPFLVSMLQRYPVAQAEAIAVERIGHIGRLFVTLARTQTFDCTTYREIMSSEEQP